MSEQELAVGVAVVTFRRKSSLDEVLRSIAASRFVPRAVAVIDNDADDSVRELVQSWRGSFSKLVYLASPVNNGPAGAMVRAQAWAEDESLGWIVRVDDDKPLPDERWIERLVDHAARQDDELLAGVGYVGTRFNWRTGDFVRVPQSELHGVVDVDVLGTNHSPMFRLDAMRAVGGFNGDLVFGFTEPEFCMRLRLAGFRLVALGDVWSELRRARTRAVREPRAHGESDWRRYYTLRNQVWALRAHLSWAAALRRAFLGIVRPLRSWRAPPQAVAQLKLSVKAVHDGFRGRLGVYRAVMPTDLPPT